jgi:hypothetical protein
MYYRRLSFSKVIEVLQAALSSICFVRVKFAAVERGSRQSARLFFQSSESGHTFLLNHRFIYLINHVNNIESLLPLRTSLTPLPLCLLLNPTHRS